MPQRGTTKIDTKDIRLIVEIKNKEPLELLELTKSLVSIANQFNTYASNYGDSKENREAKLYVKEIRSGSVILELIEYASVGVIPFLENINTIVGFADYVKSAFDFFLGKEKDKPSIFTHNDLKDLSQIVNPVANDASSQLNMSTVVNGDVHLHFTIGSMEANAAQNVIEKEEKKLKEPDIDNLDDIKTKVLLTWWQARNDIKTNTGNKGIIEELSPRPMNIIIEDDSLKGKILHDDNPFTTVYVVDVKIQTVQGKIAAYKVVKLHENFQVE